MTFIRRLATGSFVALLLGCQSPLDPPDPPALGEMIRSMSGNAQEGVADWSVADYYDFAEHRSAGTTRTVLDEVALPRCVQVLARRALALHRSSRAPTSAT